MEEAGVCTELPSPRRGLTTLCAPAEARAWGKPEIAVYASPPAYPPISPSSLHPDGAWGQALRCQALWYTLKALRLNP